MIAGDSLDESDPVFFVVEVRLGEGCETRHVGDFAQHVSDAVCEVESILSQGVDGEEAFDGVHPPGQGSESTHGCDERVPHLSGGGSFDRGQ